MFKELLLPLAVIGVIASLLIPLPTAALDFLLVSNILLALVLLGSSLYISSPLKLSALPSILLLATLYRLSLNVSTTRAILGTGFGGHVVEAFGAVVIGDNLVVGMVVFLIVTLIQFIVIAKGSERVAEVAARFTLDALPGKQMSIDADVRAGLIDFAEARRKRELLQTESRFYGALDGAMKFIKGDAIAGIIITAVNIIGGLILGVMVHELEFKTALSRYTLLTIGDGLAAQIPALLNALAAGLVVTRVEKDNQPLAVEILTQLFQIRRGQLISAAVAVIMALVPGMPALPFVVLALALLITSFYSKNAASEGAGQLFSFNPKVPPVLTLLAGKEAMQKLVADGNLVEGVERFRQQVSDLYGLVLPQPDFNVQEQLRYRIMVQIRGVAAAELTLTPDSKSQEVLFKALCDLVSANIEEFIDDQITRQMLDHMEKSAPELVNSVVPDVLPLTQVTEILKGLLHEGVPVRNLDLILQAVSEAASKTKDSRIIYEAVRKALRRIICHKLGLNSQVPVLLLAPEVEMDFVQAEREGELVAFETIVKLVESVKEAAARGRVILTTSGARRLVRECLEIQGVLIPVLSHEELSKGLEIQVIKVVPDVSSRDKNEIGMAA